MGQDNTYTAQKRQTSSSSTLLPTTTTTARATARAPPRAKQLTKTFNNIKITLLCGFVTILVLRGTIGINLSSSTTTDTSLLEAEARRVIAEIRSDGNPYSDSDFINPNTTTFSFGPTITGWDRLRKRSESEKEKVMLVSGSPPTPCDNPIGDHYLLKSVKNKIDYCRLHGIEVVYNMAHLDKDLSGYWAKLPLIRRLMLTHPDVEWVWWMDSDALFTDMVFEVPVERYSGYNMVIHGYPDLLEKRSWIALNTGSVLFRNCQWTLDFFDAWAVMGPRGPTRDQAGKVLTHFLTGRPGFEADDQSALIYLLVKDKDRWMDKVYVENQYYLHGFWTGLVDKYEEYEDKYHPGFGDERWPFVTHFVGCKPCGSYGDYPVEKCLKSMERAFNFADNQVLKLYGFRHRGLLSPKIKRVRNETSTPLVYVDQFDIRRPHVGGQQLKS